MTFVAKQKREYEVGALGRPRQRHRNPVGAGRSLGQPYQPGHSRILQCQRSRPVSGIAAPAAKASRSGPCQDGAVAELLLVSKFDGCCVNHGAPFPEVTIS